MDAEEIPYEKIGNVDLAAIASRSPAAAQEILRLYELMQEEAASPEEFHRLCELLHDAGETQEAEYLLRRNLGSDESLQHYTRLFGTTNAGIFRRAVTAFADQFGVELTLYQEWDVFDHEYESRPRSEAKDGPELLRGPCLVRISFTQRDFVTANIVADDRAANRRFDLTRYLNFRWVDGRWIRVEVRGI